jgi:hypothetical protein
MRGVTLTLVYFGSGTAKLQSGGVEGMGSEERELREYFKGLYKNSNKCLRGILLSY